MKYNSHHLSTPRSI